MPSRALRVFADLAERQAGFFTVRQAMQAGLSHRVLSYHISSGDLERVAHGVYRWTPFPQHHFGDVTAATLWVGADTAASHETALAVYELADAMPSAIHLTTPRQFREHRRGVVVHHAPLPRSEVRVFDTVPVTTPARPPPRPSRGLPHPPAPAHKPVRDSDADRLRPVLGVDGTGNSAA